jgi:hypothetical protein
MGVKRDLANVQAARGYQVGGHLVLQIAGEKPSPCYEVDIEQSPTEIFPPEFLATQWTDPGGICPEVGVPYERVEAFELANLAGQSIALRTAGGEIAVEVEDVGTLQAPALAATKAHSISIADVVGPPAEAVGHSRNYDLGEAIRDAIDQLPTRGEGIRDWLAHYEVVKIGAEVGGIGGFNHLYVRVRG